MKGFCSLIYLAVAPFVSEALAPTLLRRQSCHICIIKIGVNRLRTFTLKSKRKSAGGEVKGPSNKKIQVKLLKYVDGMGQKGDIVRVSPAVLNNVLRPSQSAIVITDEDVQKERVEALAMELKVNRQAKLLKEEISELTMAMRRKAGPDGKLFGGIGPKIIIDEIKTLLPSARSFFDGKSVKFLSIVDDNGVNIRGDIKHTGSFRSTISLTKDVVATVQVEVQDEDH